MGKVVLCGITFDKDEEKCPDLGLLRKSDDDVFYGDTMENCFDSLAIIDNYIEEGSAFMDFVNKEIWVYVKNETGNVWIGPQDTKHPKGNYLYPNKKGEAQ